MHARIRIQGQKPKQTRNPGEPKHLCAMKPIRPPMAYMTAQAISKKKTKREASFAEKSLAYTLYEDVKTSMYTLNAKYNVPQCRDHLNCGICGPYICHLEDGRRNAGFLPITNGEDSDNSEEDTDEDMGLGEEDTDNDMKLGESKMDGLFRLQDVMGLFRTMAWIDLRIMKHYEAGGIAAAKLAQEGAEQKLAQLQIEHGRVLSDRDHIQTQLAELQTKHEQVLSQRGQDQAQLQETNARLTAAVEGLQIEHGQVLSQRAQLQETSARLTAALAELDLIRRDSDLPRKHPRIEPAATPSWETLHAMSRPTALDEPIRIAQFLQFHEEADFKGIPISGEPLWAIDMRDVRGYRQIMGRAPAKDKAQSLMDRLFFGRCLTRLLRIIAVPGKYAQLLHETDIIIAPQERLTPCDFGPNPDYLSDAQVASLLAQQGVTTAIADDSWQFCDHYLRAQITKPDSFLNLPTLREILQSSQASGSHAPGLYPAEQDQYPRTVPSMRKRNRKTR
ncbi:hypothetical protein DFH06DRAFT_1347962 [Mycena polygramma]|nr:hypothetical protein DFH06DRAFT_1347962 [Mycena polygramma]